MDVVENEENEGEMNLGSEQDGGDEILSESEGEEEENKEEFIIDLSPYLQDGDKEKSLLSDDPNQYYKPDEYKNNEKLIHILSTNTRFQDKKLKNMDHLNGFVGVVDRYFENTPRAKKIIQCYLCVNEKNCEKIEDEKIPMFCFDKRNDVEEDLENYQTAKEKYFNIDEFYADYSVLPLKSHTIEQAFIHLLTYHPLDYLNSIRKYGGFIPFIMYSVGFDIQRRCQLCNTTRFPKLKEYLSPQELEFLNWSVQFEPPKHPNHAKIPKQNRVYKRKRIESSSSSSSSSSFSSSSSSDSSNFKTKIDWKSFVIIVKEKSLILLKHILCRSFCESMKITLDGKSKIFLDVIEKPSDTSENQNIFEDFWNVEKEKEKEVRDKEEEEVNKWIENIKYKGQLWKLVQVEEKIENEIKKQIIGCIGYLEFIGNNCEIVSPLFLQYCKRLCFEGIFSFHQDIFVNFFAIKKITFFYALPLNNSYVHPVYDEDAGDSWIRYLKSDPLSVYLSKLQWISISLSCGEYFQCPAYYLFKNFESDCYFCWFSSSKFIGDDEFPQTGDLKPLDSDKK